ncbi:MAG: FecR domain-containing protein [Planctomycetes bacterium]|nr:FecR domain-containing protein [Planctomycetota bacterium]
MSPHDFEELLLRYLHGEAAPEELANLGSRLERNPDGYARLLELSDEEGFLREGLQAMPAVVRKSRPTIRALARRRNGGLPPALVAAATLAAGLCVALLVLSRQDGPTTDQGVAHENVPLPPPVEELPPPVRVDETPVDPQPREEAPVVPVDEPPVIPPAAPESTPEPSAPVPPREPEPVTPPPSQPSATAAAVAALQSVDGEGCVIIEGRRDPARSGQTIGLGQGVATGPESSAVIVFTDGTQVTLQADTEITQIVDVDSGREQGKRLFMARGSLTADVVKQASGRSFVFVTPHGEAKVLGTTLRITVDDKSTSLEVVAGKVRLTRRDGKSVEVIGGHYAVAAEKGELASRPFPGVPKTRLLEDHEGALRWRTASPPNPVRLSLSRERASEGRQSLCVEVGPKKEWTDDWVYVFHPMTLAAHDESIRLRLWVEECAEHAQWTVQLKDRDGNTWYLCGGALAGERRQWRTIEAPLASPDFHQNHRATDRAFEPTQVKELIVSFSCSPLRACLDTVEIVSAPRQ